MENSETTGDTIYKWTTRTLYTAAIMLNLWYLMEQYRDTPEAKRVLTQLENKSKKILKPWRQRKHFRRMVEETLIDAEVTVNMASKDNND